MRELAADISHAAQMEKAKEEISQKAQAAQKAVEDPSEEAVSRIFNGSLSATGQSLEVILLKVFDDVGFIEDGAALEVQEEASVIEIDGAHHSSDIVTGHDLCMNEARSKLIDIDSRFEQFGIM